MLLLRKGRCATSTIPLSYPDLFTGAVCPQISSQGTNLVFPIWEPRSPYRYVGEHPLIASEDTAERMKESQCSMLSLLVSELHSDSQDVALKFTNSQYEMPN